MGYGSARGTPSVLIITKIEGGKKLQMSHAFLWAHLFISITWPPFALVHVPKVDKYYLKSILFIQC